jgi:zinc protease
MTAAFPPRPQPGAPRDYHFPTQHRQPLAHGATLVVAPQPRVPLVSVLFVFHAAGADADPGGQEGLAALTASLLLEGTTTRSGQALTDAFEALGSSLAAGADWDAATVGFTVQPRHLAAAMALATEVVRAPAFPDDELRRLQGEHASDRLQVLTEPRALAELASQWCLYEPIARYRRPISGTTASVGAISVEQVRSFWHTRYTAGALTIIVAGDVDAATAERLSAPVVAAWDAPPPPPVAIHTAARYAMPRLHLVHRADAPQSELRLTRVGVPRVHPEYFARTLMNAVFGGLFSSRINLNLRERNGYTYGAHAGFDWRRSAGPWSASTAVGTDVTVAAARELLAEVQLMREAPITGDELSLATSFLVGVFPLRFESTQAVASALASQRILGLPLDYYDTYRAAISGVSTSEIHRVAIEHFEPSALQLIVVGDGLKLRDALAALEFGPLVEHTPEAIEAAE